MHAPWDTPERRQELLCELVGWDSVTGTDGEARFSELLAARLRELPVTVQVGDAGQVTALHRHAATRRTIVLLSHFDTVDTAEFGPLEPLAFDPVRLTEAMRERASEFDADAAADLASGEYLFGRGTMDMKSGLALHMSLIEQAGAEDWPINLLLLAVPDEEVNSAGMRAAVRQLPDLAREQGSSTCCSSTASRRRRSSRATRVPPSTRARSASCFRRRCASAARRTPARRCTG
jgi:arginine utilization protein RocB